GNMSILGKELYSAIWENYQFNKGMITSARLVQPFIILYFQLKGPALIKTTVDGVDLDIKPGEANLLVVPPISESFELQENMDGTSFSIMFAENYLIDLAERYPHLLEPILTKVKQNDFWLFNRQNAVMTPRMYGIVQRI